MSNASRAFYGSPKSSSSSLNSSPGTLSRTSSSSGEVYASVAERKEANIILQETGTEPTQADLTAAKQPAQPAPKGQQVTARAIVTGEVRGREWIGIVGGKESYGVTYGEGDSRYRTTAYSYGTTDTQQIKTFHKAQRLTEGVFSSIENMLQPKEPSLPATTLVWSAADSKPFYKKVKSVVERGYFQSIYDAASAKGNKYATMAGSYERRGQTLSGYKYRAASFGLGLIEAGAGTAVFAKSIILFPFNYKAQKGLSTAFKSYVTDFAKAPSYEKLILPLQAPAKRLANVLETRPERVLSEIVFAKGLQSIGKIALTPRGVRTAEVGSTTSIVTKEAAPIGTARSLTTKRFVTEYKNILGTHRIKSTSLESGKVIFTNKFGVYQERALLNIGNKKNMAVSSSKLIKLETTGFYEKVGDKLVVQKGQIVSSKAPKSSYFIGVERKIGKQTFSTIYSGSSKKGNLLLNYQRRGISELKAKGVTAKGEGLRLYNEMAVTTKGKGGKIKLKAFQEDYIAAMKQKAEAILNPKPETTGSNIFRQRTTKGSTGLMSGTQQEAILKRPERTRSVTSMQVEKSAKTFIGLQFKKQTSILTKGIAGTTSIRLGTISATKPKTMGGTFQQSRSAQIASLRIATGQRSLELQRFTQISALNQKSNQITNQIQGQRQGSRQVQRTTLISQQISTQIPQLVTIQTGGGRVLGLPKILIPKTPPTITTFFRYKSSISRSKTKRYVSRSRQPRSLTPTGWAIFGGITGKTSLGQVRSGLGGRPLKKLLRPFRLRGLK